MYKGSCLCGCVMFELMSEPKAAVNCHCRMCQKQHGAAFATYVSVPENDLVYLSGLDMLSTYNSSEGIARKFCRRCGSNIEWSGSHKFPGWVSVALASLDTPVKPKKISDIHLESKVGWQ